jgi:hypothetical protein
MKLLRESKKHVLLRTTTFFIPIEKMSKEIALEKYRTKKYASIY